MTRIRRIIRPALRWAGLALLFALTLEVCARLDDHFTWGAPLWGHYSQALLTVSDQYGIHSRPGARFEKWHVNAHGFRGPEITPQKPDGVTRVIVLGASETFGLYESPGKDYPAQLQTMLDHSNPGRYQILNAGCAGMTLPRFTHYVQVWLKHFEPDLVFIYPTPASYVATEPPRSSFSVRKGPPPPLPDNLRLARKAKIALRAFLPAALLGWVRERNLERIAASHKPAWTWAGAPEDRVKLFRLHLTQLIDEIQKDGIKVLLATHAHRFPKSPALWTAADRAQMARWRESYPRASANCLLQMDAAGNRVVRDIAQQRGLPLVDIAAAVPVTASYLTRPTELLDLLAPAAKRLVSIDDLARLSQHLADAVAPPNHFADFVHFTDTGSQRAARAIVDVILALERDSKLSARAN